MGVSKYIKIKIASSIFNNYRVDTEVNSYRLSIKKILAFPFNLLVLCIPPILSSFANCIRMLYKYLFVQAYTRAGFPYHNFLNVMSKN